MSVNRCARNEVSGLRNEAAGRMTKYGNLRMMISFRMSTVSGGDNQTGLAARVRPLQLGGSHTTRGSPARGKVGRPSPCLGLLKFMIGDKAENRENVTEGGDG